MARILIVEDEERYRDLIGRVLSGDGHSVEKAGDVSTGLKAIASAPPDLVLSDMRMPGGSGLELLRMAREKGFDVDFIFMTAFGSKETAIDAMRLGAKDYIEKPFDNAELKQRIRNICESKALREENSRLKEQLRDRWHIKNIIGQSASMQEVAGLVMKVAPKNISVLIRGESGTGKELVARAIHAHSGQCKGPFVAINSSAMPETLLESELFGHEKGAFTGADQRKPGKFETAADGTLFLDEIGDISPAMQVKLLRVLQEKQFTRIGGHDVLECSARIIAATNRNLEEMIKTGDFREDLYYRLSVFPIMIPPLRERTEDIPPLLEHFLTKFSFAGDAMTPKALRLLNAYTWPGNVRELENTIERATILANEGRIGEKDLPPQLRMELPAAEGEGIRLEIPDEGIKLDQVEKHLIYKAIAKAKGNKTKAAQLLGISRRTLYSRLEMFGRE